MENFGNSSEMMRSSSSKSLMKSNSPKGMGLGGIFKKIGDALMQKNRYSKAEMIRNCLIDKLNSLKTANEILDDAEMKTGVMIDK